MQKITRTWRQRLLSKLAMVSKKIVRWIPMTATMMNLQKLQHTRHKKTQLFDFLIEDETIDFSTTETPTVAIILILFNRAELTLACLKSIQANVEVAVELIIVDNNSSDESSLLLDRIKGAKILLNDSNLGFLKACNQAVIHASAPHLLFLNNDSEIGDAGISDAIRTLESDAAIGAVGAKILLLDNHLQEGGSIIWNDGSCLGYGRGWERDDPRVNFERDVDYCSGAFLLTRTALFRELDGFDEAYAPAYYEETDYCVRLHKAGYRIVYQPRTEITHFEFASSEGSSQAVELMQRNAEKFRDKHGDFLSTRKAPSLNVIGLARHFDHTRPRILYIDDRVPHGFYGAGFPRSNDVVGELVKHGAHVSIMPYNFPFEDTWSTAYSDIPESVEVLLGFGRHNIRQWLETLDAPFDVIWVSRPHNMAHFYELIGEKRLGGATIVYDAEALFGIREILKAETAGKPMSPTKAASVIEKELELAGYAQQVVAVSPAEREHFAEHLELADANIHTLGHSITPRLSDPPFEDRTSILFIGNMDYCTAPNADSVLWFIQHAWPTIADAIPDVTLDLVGSNDCEAIQSINLPRVNVHGRVADLRAFYDKARIFIAPTRFAAGVPYKVHDAAAAGIPVVTTPLIASQLGWQNSNALVVCEADAATEQTPFAGGCLSLLNDRERWQQVRDAAHAAVVQDCSEERFSQDVRKILDNCHFPN
ncbi:glycosyl transferase, family 2 [gamma proteobacterium NOR5-3]|nr:glycosyl transferase, family 2 [gamma proteobacterium NOR5-3]